MKKEAAGQAEDLVLRCGAHSSKMLAMPICGDASRQRALPVAVSATHSSNGCLGGSLGPPDSHTTDDVQI